MLKFIYDTEAEIPESAKALFKKNDAGKWQLEVEGAVAKQTHDEFRQKNIDLLKEKDALTLKFKDVDPERYVALVAKEKEFDEGETIKKGGLEAAVEKRTAAMKKELEDKLTAEKKRADDAVAGLDTLRLDHSLRDAGSKHGLRPEAVGDLILRGRGVLKYVDGKLVAHDDAGQKRYGAGTDPMTHEEWVAELTKTAPHLFEASKGGGATGGDGKKGFTGDNPWAPATKNITQQMKLTRENPTLAATLKAAATK